MHIVKKLFDRRRMNKKHKRGILTLGMFVSMFTTSVMAGTAMSSYNTTVGKFNGSGYSDYQVKAVSGANGWIESEKVGGSYTVDVRMNSSAGNGKWFRNLGDGLTGELPGNSAQVSGSNVRLRFSNDITTPVNVQVIGNWKSN